MFGRFLIISFAYLHAGNIPLTSQSIVTVNVNESIVYVGLSTSTEIWVYVKEGYHIQANKVNDESLVPTTLEVKSNEFITIDKQEFPPSKQFKLDGTDSILQVYDGKFVIKLFINSVANTKAGKYVLTAKLKYQACDSRTCLFPRTVDFSIPLEVKTKE